MLKIYEEKFVKRFWSKVKVGKPNECWLWKGGKADGSGYGCYRAGKISTAHVFSLSLKLGRKIKEGLWALHTCDNKRCVNPNHLYEGTPHQNGLDRYKRRGVSPSPLDKPLNSGWDSMRGEKHHKAKLKDDDIELIRTLYSNREWTMIRLAKIFKVTANTIFHIVHKRTWKHIK